MSEHLFGNNCQFMDLRNETCTNLSIQFSLLVKRMKEGEIQKIMLTRKQYSQIEGIPPRLKLFMKKEKSGNDYLITISSCDT